MRLASKDRGAVVLPLVLLTLVTLTVLLVIFAKGLIHKKPNNTSVIVTVTPAPEPPQKSDVIITKLSNGSTGIGPIENNNKYIVWIDYGNNTIQDCKNGNIAHQPCLSQVYLYNIKGKTVEKISGVDQWISNLKIFNDTVEWGESANQNALYEENSHYLRVLYNISTKKSEDITNEEGKRVSDNEVAYIKNSQTGPQGTTSVSSVYILDLDTKKENKIIEVSKPSDSAYGNLDGYSVSGNYVYYVVDYWDAGAPGSILYGKNLSSQDITEIARLYGLGGGDVHYTSSNNLISWLEYTSKDTAFKNGDFDLYVLDMKTKEKSLVAQLKHSSLISPRINNNFIMYYKEREGIYYIYDINTKTTDSFGGFLPWTLDRYKDETMYVEDSNKEITYFTAGGQLIRVVTNW